MPTNLATKIIPLDSLRPNHVRRAGGEPLSQKLLRELDPYAPGLPEWLHYYRLRNLANVQRGIHKLQAAEAHDMAYMFGQLRLKHIPKVGEARDYGLVSTRVVTTAGVNFIVDAFQNTASLPSMKYHGIGTGDSNAEAVGDTALEAELGTEYSTTNTRATGTTTEGATSNIYRTVGTVTVQSGPLSIVEHGIFSQASTGGGTLLDRSVFSAITLQNGDSLQCTYELTLVAGS